MEKIKHAIVDGAPFSFVNLVVLAVVIAIAIERLMYIRSRYYVVASEFMSQIRKLIQAGNIDRAVRLCEAEEKSPLLQVIKSGLTQANKGDEAVISAMDERWSELQPALEKRIGSLWTWANIATLIGLLGTIKGLIGAFDAVGNAPAAERSSILSGAISEAMYNTFLGLFIAVVAMSFHLWLHSSSKKIKHEVELSTMKLENLLFSKGK